MRVQSIPDKIRKRKEIAFPASRPHRKATGIQIREGTVDSMDKNKEGTWGKASPILASMGEEALDDKVVKAIANRAALAPF